MKRGDRGNVITVARGRHVRSRQGYPMTPCAYPPRPVLSREAGKLKGEDNFSVQKSVGF